MDYANTSKLGRKSEGTVPRKPGRLANLGHPRISAFPPLLKTLRLPDRLRGSSSQMHLAYR